MDKYFVQYIVNGNLQIAQITEWGNLESAKAKWHDVCKLMWATQEVETAVVVLLDANLNRVEGDKYREFIYHAPQPEVPEEVSEE